MGTIHEKCGLGKVRLDELTRERVKRFVAHLVDKKLTKVRKEKFINEQGRAETKETTVEYRLARPSIRIILSELCAVFNHAKEDGLIADNPATRLSKFYKQSKVVHEEIQPLTKEEVPLFLAASNKTASQYYPLFLCALHTGMRSGELAALRWADIDFSGKFIRLRRSVSRGKVGATKNGKPRRVDGSDELIRTLQDMRRQRQAECLQKGSNEIPEWVFINAKGNRIDMHNVKERHFHRCLAAAGLRRIRFHDLRHTYATLLLMQGESPVYVKEQLGHSSITLTVDIYGHWIPGANRQAVNRLPGLKMQQGLTG